MQASGGTRLAWDSLPSAVHAAVADMLGSPVVSAVSQAGGFSPGSADRVVTEAGRRAFVKAVSPEQNPETPDLHRREVAVNRVLPPDVPAPPFLGAYDDGRWVVLVFDDVDGRQPRTPWRGDELDSALDTAGRIAATMSPPPVGLADRTAASAADLRGWEVLRAEASDVLDDWARQRLDLLCELGARAAQLLIDGETLAHADLRADNMLVRPDGSILAVDWPFACRAPAWYDRLTVLLEAEFRGGHDTDGLVRVHCPDASADDVTAVLAGLAGFFLDRARRPPPPGVPKVRAFQLAQGRSTQSWVRRRLEGI